MSSKLEQLIADRKNPTRACKRCGKEQAGTKPQVRVSLMVPRTPGTVGNMAHVLNTGRSLCDDCASEVYALLELTLNQAVKPLILP